MSDEEPVDYRPMTGFVVAATVDALKTMLEDLQTARLLIASRNVAQAADAHFAAIEHHLAQAIQEIERAE